MATRHGVGSSHDADDQIAALEAAVRRRFEHAAERLVTENEALAPRWRPAVLAANDLEISPADTHGQAFDEELAGAWSHVAELVDTHGSGLHRNDGNGAHAKTSIQLPCHIAQLRGTVVKVTRHMSRGRSMCTAIAQRRAESARDR
jgi:hypothetical protein